MTTPRREVFWVPLDPTKIQTSVGQIQKALPIDMPERPTRVYTITAGRDWRNPDVKPEPFFPFVPAAFPEDVGHDWQWEGGQLRYFSRVCNGNVWIMVEFGDCSQLFQQKFCGDCGAPFTNGHICP